MPTLIKPIPPLLRLPLELRHIIYRLLLPLITPDNRFRCGPQESLFLISRLVRDRNPELLCLGRDPRPPLAQTGLLSLRGGNRQLYGEISALLYINPTKLRIVDTLTFKDCSAAAVLNLVKQPWIRQNVVSVELYIAYDGLRFTYPDRYEYAMSPKITARYPSAYGSLWSYLRNRLLRHDAGVEQPRNLSQLAKVLNTFPQLKNVTIWTDTTMLFDIWSDPVGDAQAFRPLLDRGVFVSFGFPPFFDTKRVSEYQTGFDTMLRRKRCWGLNRNGGTRVEWTQEGDERHLVAVED